MKKTSPAVVVWVAVVSATGIATVLAASTHAPTPEPSCMAIALPTVQGIPGNGPEVAGGIRDLVAG